MSIAGRLGIPRILELQGWRRVAIAAGFGLLTGLAFAPLRQPLFLIVGFSGLALLLEGAMRSVKPKWASFFAGWAFGTAYFSLTMAWLGNAFLVQADQFAWMIPIILPLFFGGLGLFYGVAGAGAAWVRGRTSLEGPARLLPLLFMLGVTEWLRGHILTGLPWNLHAQAAAASGVLLQPLAWFGPYGYGLILTAIAISPAAAILDDKTWPRWLLAALGGIVLLFGTSASRLATLDTPTREDVAVVVAQPSIAQRDKLDADKRVAALRRTIDMTARAAEDAIPGQSVYAVWPENAYPFLHQVPDLGAVLASILPPESFLISGSIRSVPGPERGFANTLFVFGPSDKSAPLTDVYDKHRLVPFGETLPFYEAFAALGLQSLAPTGGRGFIPGAGPKRVAEGPAPFAPLICYEDVFPGTLYPRSERPDWLVVVTNDAWFGDRAGPMQHLDIARMRAVETGLPLVRSANTGISAIIDPLGRITHRLPLYEPGVIAAPLHAPREMTAFTRAGDGFFYVVLIGIAMFVAGSGLHGRMEIGNPSEKQDAETRGYQAEREQASAAPD